MVCIPLTEVVFTEAPVKHLPVFQSSELISLITCTGQFREDTSHTHTHIRTYIYAKEQKYMEDRFTYYPILA